MSVASLSTQFFSMTSACRQPCHPRDARTLLLLRVCCFCAARFFLDLVATLPYHVIGAISTLGSSGSVQMLTVAICKIPIFIRLFRLAHKLDEVMFSLSMLGNGLCVYNLCARAHSFDPVVLTSFLALGHTCCRSCLALGTFASSCRCSASSWWHTGLRAFGG